MICNNCRLKVTLLAALTGLIIKNKTANLPERRLRQFEQIEIRLICTGLPSLTTSGHFTAVFVSGFSFDKSIKNTASRRNDDGTAAGMDWSGMFYLLLHKSISLNRSLFLRVKC